MRPQAKCTRSVRVRRRSSEHRRLDTSFGSGIAGCRRSEPVSAARWKCCWVPAASDRQRSAAAAADWSDTPCCQGRNGQPRTLRMPLLFALSFVVVDQKLNSERSVYCWPNTERCEKMRGKLEWMKLLLLGLSWWGYFVTVGYWTLTHTAHAHVDTAECMLTDACADRYLCLKVSAYRNAKNKII